MQVLRPIFQQAITISDSFTRFCPLIRPAIIQDQKGQWQMDEDLLAQRITLTFVSAMANLWLSLVFLLPNSPRAYKVASTFFILSMCSWAAFFVTFFFDEIKASHALLDLKEQERKKKIADAIDDYQTHLIPSVASTEMLKQDLEAMQLFIQKGGNVNQVNEHGGYLLDTDTPLEVMRLLVKNGAFIHQKIGTHTFCEYALFKQDSSYFKVLLEEDVLTPANLSIKDQFTVWLNLQDPKLVFLLTQKGFDLNIKWPQTGTTPLLELVHQTQFHQDQQFLEMVSAFINNGADLQAKKMIQGKLQGVFDLSRSLVLTNLLQSCVIQP